MRNTIMYDEDGQPLIASYGGGATVNRQTGKPEAIPKDLLAIYPLGQKYEGMEYLPRKISLPKDLEPEIFDEIPVHRYHIDVNRHMNNARYLDVAEDYRRRISKHQDAGLPTSIRQNTAILLFRQDICLTARE